MEQLPRFFFIDLNKMLGYSQIIKPFESLVKVLMPYTQTVAFILLVWAFMKNNLEGERKKTFEVLVRSIILVAIIFMSPKLGETLDSMVKALLSAPVTVNSADGGQITGQLGPDPDKAIAGIGKLLNGIVDPASYAALGARAQADQSARQQQLQPQSGGNQIQQAWDATMKGIGSALQNIPGFKYVAEGYSMAKNFGWTVFYWMIKLAQTLAGLIIYLGYAIQRLLLLAMSLYLPIVMGEMASRTLRTRAVHFLLLYIGLFCWPLGWAVVNIVVLVILASFPQASAVSLEDLIRMFFMFLPLCLGILVGYIVAPFFVQKIIARGGSSIQGFGGQVIAGLGKATAYSSAAFLGGGLIGAAGALSHGGGLLNRLGGGLAPVAGGQGGSESAAEANIRPGSAGPAINPGNRMDGSAQDAGGISSNRRGGMFGVSARALARASDKVLAGAQWLPVVAGDTLEMTGRNMAETSGDRIEGYQLSPPGFFNGGGRRLSGRKPSRTHQTIAQRNSAVHGKPLDSSERARKYL